MSYADIPTPTAAGDPLSTDKCCCGHPRSEHTLSSESAFKKAPCDRCNRVCPGCRDFGKCLFPIKCGSHKCQHFTQSYRIIDTDNFGGDYPNEKVIAAGITYKPFADAMCEALIAKFGGDRASRFYRVVEDDYVLQPGFEP